MKEKKKGPVYEYHPIEKKFICIENIEKKAKSKKLSAEDRFRVIELIMKKGITLVKKRRKFFKRVIFALKISIVIFTIALILVAILTLRSKLFDLGLTIFLFLVFMLVLSILALVHFNKKEESKEKEFDLDLKCDEKFILVKEGKIGKFDSKEKKRYKKWSKKKEKMREYKSDLMKLFDFYKLEEGRFKKELLDISMTYGVKFIERRLNNVEEDEENGKNQLKNFTKEEEYLNELRTRLSRVPTRKDLGEDGEETTRTDYQNNHKKDENLLFMRIEFSALGPNTFSPFKIRHVTNNARLPLKATQLTKTSQKNSINGVFENSENSKIFKFPPSMSDNQDQNFSIHEKDLNRSINFVPTPSVRRSISSLKLNRNLNYESDSFEEVTAISMIQPKPKSQPRNLKNSKSSM